MSTSQLTGRRALFAIAAAIAVIGAPAVAALAGAPAISAPRILAGCVTNLDPGDASLDCEPPAIDEPGGAPGEMQLTDTNEGEASSESPVHGR